jgi:hypothetical protein
MTNAKQHNIAKQHTILRIKQLVWLYFFLLIFEGALRKWLLPSLSGVLLIVRDPVALAIYYLAYRANIFPRNGFILWGGIIALLSLIAGLCAVDNTPAVALFGFRCSFLSWPLVFILPRVFNEDDLKRVGHWVLLLAVPMAALMVLQFRAPSNSWLNIGAGGEGGQLAAASGHIRPAGTFSFISGPINFYALVTAFLFNAQLRRGQFPTWALFATALSLVSAVAVSGSRGLLLSVTVVVLCAFFAGAVLQPTLLFRWLWSACMLALVVFATQNLSFMQEGRETFTQRVENASRVEGGAEGFVGRILYGFTVGPLLYETPLLGRGLGMGTVAGSQLLTGEVQFLLAEGEWARVLLESGPILGAAFLLWRLYLAGWLCWQALQKAMRGDALPLLLFGVCGLSIINGQMGQATTQGFVIFSSALCLTAIRCAGREPQRRRRSRFSPISVRSRRPRIDPVPTINAQGEPL